MRAGRGERRERIRALARTFTIVVLAILAVLGWAVNSGQFEDIEQEGLRILQPEGQSDKGSVEPYQE